MAYSPNFNELLFSLGLIDGFETVNKFGEAIDCDSGVPTDIHDGADGSASTGTDIWVPPTQSRIHNITSSNLNDTSAGSGAKTIRVFGLVDWDSAEVSEDIIMNGTSDVATSNSYVIIHRVQCLTWGADGMNQGDITATAQTDNTVTAAILTGNNQTQMCIYGVPSIQKLRVSKIYSEIVKSTGSTQRADGEVLVMIDPATNAANNTAWTNKQNFLLVEANNPWTHDYKEPKKFDGPCIVKIQVTTNSNNTKCIGGFDGTVYTTD